MVLTLFHLTNAMIFEIGIFPWFSIAMTLLFFAPDWPRRVFRFRRAVPVPEAPTAPFSAPQRLALAFVTVWVTLQVMIPLRPHFYDGNPSWTEEAHRFSWRQKLRSKRSVLKYVLVDPAKNLADVKRTFFEPYDFIVPLEIPLSSQWDEGEITDPQSLELLERHKGTHRRGPSP